MAYTFELTISGIIAVVKQDGGKRLRLVVPNTLLDAPAPGPHKPTNTPTSVDKTTPRFRHEPVFRWAGGPRVPLRGYSLSFGLPGADASDPDLGFTPRLPEMTEALAGLTGASCQLAEEYLDAVSTEKVAAVLDITQGRVETLACGKAKMDSVTGNAGTERPMAYALRWSVTGLEAPPTVLLVDLDGRPVLGPVQLFTDAKGVASAMLMNHRAHRGKPVDPKAVRDDDFRWYYELLENDSREAVEDELDRRNAEAPVPTQTELCPRTADLYPSTGGQLCRPCEFCGPD